ncbi:peptide ABC transporter permease [Bradyrhizobium cytisi]|uniref:Peptide ABC transporter permease n=1 Tax=Bradyrhizobium cytisi TaxID=515489 RepID=A0A5S4WT59_9BRAD|nr:peptide ABC transporter permease [Bradyrhizobium cytisi]
MERARGGETILKTLARKAIFVAGLAGAAVLALMILILTRQLSPSGSPSTCP